MIYPEQIRAARALLGISQGELSRLAGVSPTTIKRLEARSVELHATADTLLRIQRALEGEGIVFVDNGAMLGAALLKRETGQR